MLSLLELLQQIPPFVGTHGRRPIEAFLPHLGGDLLPEMLVGLGGVEESVHASAEHDQGACLVLDPRLRSFLGSFHFVVLAAAFSEENLLRLEMVMMMVGM